MSRTTGWTLAVLAVAAALVAGLVVELRRDVSTVPSTRSAPAAGAADLTELRERAELPPCRVSSHGAGSPALRDIVLPCAADGEPVDVPRMFAGRRVVLNLWAYWCAPCRAELPAFAEYQRRAGADVTVVTVHQDANEGAGLALLTELGVQLPTLQDDRRQLAAALRVPNVMPASVVLAADGSVARILPQAFSTVDEIAAAVEGEAR